jgi:hypothetical protein
MHKLFRPVLEQLENRLVPNASLWPDADHLTLSFVPDGTSVAGQSSNLNAKFNAVAPTATWQQTILKAFQTWASQSNINVGVVADGGEPLGTTGLDQSDPRFGDIRIAAAPLASTAAATAAFYQEGSTWSGDVIFNSNFSFGTGAGQYDLYTVALHEAGHVFNLPDQTTDPTSVEYATYQGVVQGPSAADIQAVQSFYGVRTGDAFSAGVGNHTLQTAAPIVPASGATTASPMSVSGDVTTNQDVEYFSFQIDAGSHPNGVNVQLRTSGLSLLTAGVTVYNQAGAQVASATAANPLNGDVPLNLSNVTAGATYYVKVQSASSDVFGVGSYQLNVDLHPQSNNLVQQLLGTVTGLLTGNTSGQTSVPKQLLQNAQVLHSPSGPDGATPLVALNSIQRSAQADVYQFTTLGLFANLGGVRVNLSSFGVGIVPPTLLIVAGNGNIVASTTSTDIEGGNLTLSPALLLPSTTYYVIVATGQATTFGLGEYGVLVDLHPATSGVGTSGPLLDTTTGSKSNNSLAAAANLASMPGYASASRYATIDSLTSGTAANYYRVQSPNYQNGQSGVLTVSIVAQNGSVFSPQITAYDANFNALPVTVLTNNGGIVVVQVDGVTGNSGVYLQVNAPAGTSATTAMGNYYLSADFAATTPVALQTYTPSSTLNAATTQLVQTLNVGQNELFNFSLTAVSPGEGMVQMEIFDSFGNSVFTLNAYAGQLAATGMVYLQTGTYTVRFVAIYSANATDLSPISFSLAGEILSDPMGPRPINPAGSSSNSQSGPSSTTTTVSSTPPTNTSTTTSTSSGSSSSLAANSPTKSTTTPQPSPSPY